MVGACKLCGLDSKLELSHILPKFIFRWIIKTSATGRLRGMGNPNIPLQDGKKMHLLCSSCEDKFNKYETWFANKMFHPAISGVSVFEYDHNLYRFIVSLFWRVIVINMNREVYDKAIMRNNLIESEKRLRDFLNSSCEAGKANEVFVIPVSYIESAPRELKGLNYYFTRATDVQILFDNSENKMFFYCVMPFFIIVGNVVGLNKIDFAGCTVDQKKGQLFSKDVIVKDMSVASFMQSQINRIDTLSISDAQQKSIDERALKDIDKFLKSSSFKATFMDYIRE
jgi:hypothetical protein